MFDFLLQLFTWLSLGLGLLFVLILWALIIFVVVDEFIGLFRGNEEEEEV